MEIVLRALGVYLFLLVLFRLTGKRTLSELSTFDFVLLLIISEATQNALVDDDRSVVTALAVILTLVLADLVLSILKARSSTMERISEGVPVLLVNNGKFIDEHLARTNVTRTDILQSARENQGVEDIGQIKYALLETSGSISIIPMDAPGGGAGKD